jgi:cytochrome c2
MTPFKLAGGALVAAVVSLGADVVAQDLEKGAAVYAAQKCAMCHVLDGKGQAKGPLDGIGSRMTAEDLRQWIVDPAAMTAKAKALRKPAMRSYAKLPKEDIDALVAFLASKRKA